MFGLRVGMGGAYDDAGGVLEQAGRQRGRTQLLGRSQGNIPDSVIQNIYCMSRK